MITANKAVDLVFESFLFTGKIANFAAQWIWIFVLHFGTTKLEERQEVK